jgi:hypothetical protein
MPIDRSLERGWERGNKSIDQSRNLQQRGKGGIAVNNHSIRGHE